MISGSGSGCKAEGDQSRSAALAANRFDFLRLAFACGVFAFHAWVLAAFAPDGAVERSLGHMAELSIQGFFIVSGALVFGSLERTRSLLTYASKRIRRLYPAYATIILIPVLISGFMTGWARPEALMEYLGANLIFLNFLSPDLPGLFADNRFSAVNGALWTLKVEVLFYMVLPVFAVFLRLFGRFSWVLFGLVYVLAEMWRLLLPVYFHHPLAEELSRQLPGQMAFFVSGMVLWKLWRTAAKQPGLFGLVGLALVLVSFLSPWLEPLRAAGLGGIIGYVAFAPGPSLQAARFGDISYGVYITHFPIIQALVMLGLFGPEQALVGIAAATALVLLASFLLWHLVERPALRRDSHYRRAEAQA